jgi:flagellar hook-length control protein FliK
MGCNPVLSERFSVPTVPTDPVQPGASLARATSPQASAASSGETSPFEVLLGTGPTPPSPASAKQAAPSRPAPTGQSPMQTAAASQLRASLAAPGTPSAPAPTPGSNDDSSERGGLVGDLNQQGRVAADAPGATTTLPMPTSTNPAAARMIGESMAAAQGSASPNDPQPAPARKSDKASAKSGDVNTAALAASAPIGAPQQVAGPTIPMPAVTAAALAPVPPSTPTASVPAAPQPAAVAAATAVAAAAPATVPSSEAAPGGGAAAAATLPAGDLPSLALDPTAPEHQAAAVEPTFPELSGEKPANSPAASVEVAGAKPMVAGVKQTQAWAGPTPTPGSGSAGAAVEGANAEFQSANAAASAANAANRADVTLASGAHVDPPDTAPPSPDTATAPSAAALAQSAAPSASANSLVPPTAAPSTASPTPSPPLSPAAVPLSGLAVEIAARVTGDEKSFQIRLDPPELGRIDVQLSVDASGHVTTHLTVDRPETLNLLRQDAPSLQRALESTGLKAGSGGLEFSLRNQSSGGEAGGQRGGQSNATASPVARIIVTDEDILAGQSAPRSYARLLGVGTGVDIRV